jgi:hypothetical protein
MLATCRFVTCQRATPIDRGGSVKKNACGSGGLALVESRCGGKATLKLVYLAGVCGNPL